jgi:hypothetical protein
MPEPEIRHVVDGARVAVRHGGDPRHAVVLPVEAPDGAGSATTTTTVSVMHGDSGFYLFGNLPPGAADADIVMSSDAPVVVAIHESLWIAVIAPPRQGKRRRISPSPRSTIEVVFRTATRESLASIRVNRSRIGGRRVWLVEGAEHLMSQDPQP